MRGLESGQLAELGEGGQGRKDEDRDLAEGGHDLGEGGPDPGEGNLDPEVDRPRGHERIARGTEATSVTPS